jgi:hypothetical protein
VLFRTNPDKVFIDSPQGPLLNISWASIALLDLVIPLQPLLYFHDRLKPKARVMELIPEIKELLTGQAWRYWTRDFWWDFIRQKDPLLKINWSMIREMVRRITTGQVDVAFNKSWLTNTVEQRPQELFVTGHLHRPGGELIGHKRVMQLGCFRDEYYLLDEGRSFEPILKPYCEIYLKGERIVQLVVREIAGPPPVGAPASIFDVVPKLREMLDAMGDRSGDEAERRKQEAAEAAERNHEPKG